MDSHFMIPVSVSTDKRNNTIMAPLMKKIVKHIDSAVEDFCKQIATRFDLNATELIQMWKMAQSGSAKKNTPTKKSGYVMFGLEVRPQIVAEHPEFTFAEISKEVGRRWKLVSADENEKRRYKEMGEITASAAVEATQVDADEPKVPALVAVIQDQFAPMKTKELKNLCKARGLRISGKREELVERLRRADSTAALTPPPLPLKKMAPAVAVAAPLPDDEESFSRQSTPGSMILPTDMLDLEEMDEEDADPEPLAPKKMHKKLAASPFPDISTAPHKKKSKWMKLTMEELQSQCDQYDIDVDDNATREELVYVLDNYISY